MKKLQDTKLYPFVVALITNATKAVAVKNPDVARLFKARMDAYVQHFGAIGNLPIVSNEDEEVPEWFNLLTETIADNLVAKDFLKNDLRLAVSNLIVCYTESIKKPKLFEELLYTDISDSIDKFEDFELIRDEDVTSDDLIEQDEEEEDVDALLEESDEEDEEEDSSNE